MTAAPPDNAQVELLRVWSDPLPHAHAQWWRDDPAALVRAAATSRPGRQLLRERLRQRVPLPQLHTVCDVAVAPWGMTGPRRLAAVLDHTGFLLMKEWMAHAVLKADVAAVVAFVGKSNYDKSLQAGPTLWCKGAWQPRPDYGVSTKVIHSVFRSLGFAAAQQALQGSAQALLGRIRLVVGPQPALDGAPAELAFDREALLEQLRQWTSKPAP
jgi:hypothetical protein